MADTAIPFIKAHATGNDFVLILDPAGERHISATTVHALCARQTGIGADGLIRAVPAHLDAEATSLLEAAEVTSAEENPIWFMDYRNADGSAAETCGNGIRAFTHTLITAGLVTISESQQLPVLTRAGLKSVRLVPEGYATSMGVWSFIDPELASERASDSFVSTVDMPEPRPALSISMGNPHTVVALEDTNVLEKLNLSEAPQVEPVPSDGTNVEFVVPAEPLTLDGTGRVHMRVHERGSGETLSCGTGACAAAAAVRVWANDASIATWMVKVPGGELTVRFQPRPDGSEEVELAGSAVIVFHGELPAEAFHQG